MAAGEKVESTKPEQQNLFDRPAARLFPGDRHHAANAEAARIILSNIARFGGEDSGLVRWARLWTERYPQREAA